jgi:UDP-glucose 6-dehydrogenase
MTIGIIGPGRLGICFALLLEKSGHSVVVSDIKKSYVDAINNKIIESNEPHVNELLHSSTKLKAVYTNSQIIDQCDLIFAIVEYKFINKNRNEVFVVSSFNDFLITIQSMMKHNSQLVWFRWLYIFTSRYMFMNNLEKI